MRRCVAHKGPSGAFVTYCYISCFIKFASVAFYETILDLDLDLGSRDLTLVRDTLSHYVLSFCEVSLNLLQ